MGSITRYSARSAILLLVSWLPVASVASGPGVSEEFQVNTFTTGQQTSPAVAAGVGGFAVAWRSDSGDSSVVRTGLYARMFSVEGVPLTSELEVEADDPGRTLNTAPPCMTFENDGTLVIVWGRLDLQGSVTTVRARRFSPDGNPLGDAFDLDFSLAPRLPQCAMTDDALLVVGNVDDSVRARAFRDDVPIGPEFVVAEARAGWVGGGSYQGEQPTYTTLKVGEVDVAATANGEFVVVWDSQSYNDGYEVGGTYLRYNDVFLRRGVVEGDLQAATALSRRQAAVAPAAGVDPGGEFVVAYTECYGRRGCYSTAYDRRMGYTSLYLQKDFLPGSTRELAAGAPDRELGTSSIASRVNHAFTVVWDSLETASYGNVVLPSRRDVFARHYADTRQAIGDEFRVNTFTTGKQADSAARMLDNGDVIVVWVSQEQDGSGQGVFGARLDAVGGLPCGDATDDGAVTSSDALVVLAASVQVEPCIPCRCDADRSGRVTAIDALAVLLHSVGNLSIVPLRCETCGA